MTAKKNPVGAVGRGGPVFLPRVCGSATNEKPGIEAGLFEGIAVQKDYQRKFTPILPVCIWVRTLLSAPNAV